MQELKSVSGQFDKPIFIEPDLKFIREIDRKHGEHYKKCMQCGTCSAVCSVSPDYRTFPGKEMAWATWGLKDRLLKDPDIWLCFQCNDCSTRCPRGARPGDVLATLRQESIFHNSFPRFFGRWVNQPQYIPLLLAIPIILLMLFLYFKETVVDAFGLSPSAAEKISYAYSNLFPHWFINSFFFFFSALALVVAIIGVIRFWKTIKAADTIAGSGAPTRGIFPSFFTVLKDIFIHKKFTECTSAGPRYLSHMAVFFGFLALSLVSFWVVTSSINPLIRGEFIYPFNFLSPWKLLANIGGLAVLGGCLLMIWDRFKEDNKAGSGTYFDWALISAILIVVLTGFITEILHYVRLEPHRHIAYFAHLVFIFTLLIYLPYSKLAHLLYRTTALVYIEHTGRDRVVIIKTDDNIIIDQQAEAGSSEKTDNNENNNSSPPKSP